MSWITDDWRLKLLALGLAMLMLGAVAFSQNPPTSKTFGKTIDYTVPSGLMVINPPSRTSVTVTGLADTISSVTPSSVVASIDLTKASAGPSVKVNLVVRSLVLGVTVQNPVVPEALNIDQRAAVKLSVTVRTPRVTPGWEVTKAEASCPTAPCSVTFDGPVSLETNLKAYADYTNPVQTSSDDVLTQPIVLEQNGTALDLAKLSSTIVPQPTLDINAAHIRIEAKTGTTSTTVPLVDSAPSNPPPSGYRVTGIAISPVSVIITGDPTVLGRIQRITLPPLDLSSSTSTVTFKVQIPYPDNVNGSVAIAQVTYTIARNPNASPSP